MIDYFALALGHGLFVLAFMRLVMRDSLDIDPAITQFNQEAEARRPLPRARRRAEAAQEADSTKREKRSHQSGRPRSPDRTNRKNRTNSKNRRSSTTAQDAR